MAVSVSIDARNLMDFGRKLDVFIKEFPEEAEKLTKDMADDVAEGMRKRVRVWHGSLKGSIKTEKINEGYAVRSYFYGKFLEKGHKLVITPKLKGWAKQKFGENANKVLAKMIKKANEERGGLTKPHPFIQPSIDDTVNKFESMAKFRLKTALIKSRIGK